MASAWPPRPGWIRRRDVAGVGQTWPHAFVQISSPSSKAASALTVLRGGEQTPWPLAGAAIGPGGRLAEEMTGTGREEEKEGPAK